MPFYRTTNESWVLGRTRGWQSGSDYGSDEPSAGS